MAITANYQIQDLTPLLYILLLSRISQEAGRMEGEEKFDTPPPGNELASKAGDGYSLAHEGLSGHSSQAADDPGFNGLGLF